MRLRERERERVTMRERREGGGEHEGKNVTKGGRERERERERAGLAPHLDLMNFLSWKRVRAFLRVDETMEQVRSLFLPSLEPKKKKN